MMDNKEVVAIMAAQVEECHKMLLMLMKLTEMSLETLHGRHPVSEYCLTVTEVLDEVEPYFKGIKYD